MKRHFFTTCGECGNDRPNYSGICDGCAPMYRDSDRSPEGGNGAAGAVHESAGAKPIAERKSA